MPITPRTTILNQIEYENLRFALIGTLEGKKNTPYFDSAGLITIGVGFLIDNGNEEIQKEVLDAMNLSEAQKTDIRNLIKNGSPALTEIKNLSPGNTKDEKLATLFAQTVGAPKWGQIFILDTRHKKNRGRSPIFLFPEVNPTCLGATCCRP